MNQDNFTSVDEEIITSLSNSLSWRRVHVSFSGCVVPGLGHNHIQVRIDEGWIKE